MLGVLCWLVITELLRLDVFLVVSLVGFVLLREFTSPFEMRLPWLARLRWVVVAGYAVFFVYALSVVFRHITV